MGSGASIEQKPLPDVIDKETFKGIVGEQYTDLFETLKNEEGVITKQKMMEMQEILKHTQLLREKFNKSLDLGATSLTVDQLEELMNTLGYTPTEQELANPNGDRMISFLEFLNIMLSKMSNLSLEKEILETFAVFDLNSDGYISAAELTEVLNDMGEKITESEAQEMIAEADIDHDGKLNLKEYSLKMT